MAEAYAQDVFQGYILQGRLKAALAYLQKFPEKAALYDRYVKLFTEELVCSEQEPDHSEQGPGRSEQKPDHSKQGLGRFEQEQDHSEQELGRSEQEQDHSEQGPDHSKREQVRSECIDPELNAILRCYQKYYRDVFYRELDAAEAEARLRGRLEALFPAEGATSLDELEERQIAAAFREKGYFFLGGRTSGYYGPYVWKTEELRQYAVELPDGTQEYAVKLLDGFLSRSWIDALTFGETGTGGWSNGDGLIHCVRSAYDLESEDFRVSLLKHEAQHAQDLARYGQMSSADLEYRAKLVELIYSGERNMLCRFALQAGDSPAENGHAGAASRITAEFEALLGCARGAFGEIPIARIQAAARKLFAQSTQETARKYLPSGT